MAEYPKELTDELREVLGMPNFQCSPLAQAFRIAGHEIPHKSEHEQAFVLHWLTGIVLEHGAIWREIAGKQLEKMAADAKAAAA